MAIKNACLTIAMNLNMIQYLINIMNGKKNTKTFLEEISTSSMEETSFIFLFSLFSNNLIFLPFIKNYLLKEEKLQNI